MAGGNVIKLEYDGPNPDVVAIARRILQDAESGKIRAIIATVELKGGEYAYTNNGEWTDHHSVIGALNRQAYRMNVHMDSLAYPDPGRLET